MSSWKDERMVEAGKKAHLTKLRNQGRLDEAEEYMKQMGIKKGAETLAGNVSAQIAQQHACMVVTSAGLHRAWSLSASTTSRR